MQFNGVLQGPAFGVTLFATLMNDIGYYPFAVVRRAPFVDDFLIRPNTRLSSSLKASAGCYRVTA